MTRLHDALHDLAEKAPQIDLTGRVRAQARRRRRVRLVALPAVAVGVAATVAIGSLVGGGLRTTGVTQPALTQPKDLLNTGAVPGPLPAGRVEPVKFAYLDWCRQVDIQKPALGDCAQWRLVGRSGKQWRVADGLGAYSARTGNTDMNRKAPLQISNDGRRIAYYRPTDEHFVVRDLVSGDLTVIAQRVPLASLYSSPAELMFSGNGQQLAISFSTAAPGHALLADTATGAVHTLPGIWVIGLGTDASTVTLAETKGERTTLLLSEPDGTLRDRVQLSPNVHLLGSGNMVSPDRHTLLTLPGAQKNGPTVGPEAPLDTVTLVDIRTGKVVGTRHFHLPKGSASMATLTGWAGKSTLFVSAIWPASPPPSYGKLFLMGYQGHLADLNTGRTRVFGTIKLQAAHTNATFGGFMP